jgi:hypothetical protein
VFSSLAFANQYANEAVVEGNVAANGTSIAFDAQGNQAICYADFNTDALSFAYFDGQNWQTEIVDDDNQSGKVVGIHCALIFDHQDIPHIIYYQSNDEELRHAYFANNNWTINVIDDEASLDLFVASQVQDHHRLSVALDSQNIIATVYYDAVNDDLIYAQWDGVQWETEVIADQGDVGRYASVDFDQEDNPGIVYMETTGVQSSRVMYVYHDGAQWLEPEVIDQVTVSGSYASFQFDKNGVPHVVYQQRDAQNYTYIKYTNKVGGSWNAALTLAHGSNLGHYAQIIVSVDGNAHIIYRDYFTSALFPNVNYIKIYHVLFADQFAPNQTVLRGDVLSFSSFPVRDYSGMSIAVTQDNNLVYAFNQENRANHQFSLYAGELTAWTPVLKLTTPNAIQNRAQNDSFEVQWLTFQAEPNREIRFFYWDQNFNEVQIGDTVAMDGLDSFLLDVSEINPGSYTILAKMSTDGFQTSRMSRALTDLVVPNRAINNVGQNNPVVIPANNNPGQAEPKNNRPLQPRAMEKEEADVAFEDGRLKLKFENAQDADGDALQYVIQICADKDCLDPVFEKAGVDPDAGEHTLVDLLADEIGTGEFYWRVKAVDENDESSDWSAAVKFSLDEDSSEESDAAVDDTDTDDLPGNNKASLASAGCSLFASPQDDNTIRQNFLIMIACFLPLIMIVCMRIFSRRACLLTRNRIKLRSRSRAVK